MDITFIELIKGTVITASIMAVIALLLWGGGSENMKENEKYWTFFTRWLDCKQGIKLVVETDYWRGNVAEYAKLKCGWVYKTYADAVLALPDVAQELGMEYKL